jgi:hypothetical protein
MQLYWVIKVRQHFHWGKWFTRDQNQQKVPHLIQEIDAMGTISSQERTTNLGGCLKVGSTTIPNLPPY